MAIGTHGEGEVKVWFGDKGFGFIIPDGGGSDLFCHAGDIGDKSLIKGCRVSYEIGKNKGGQPVAVNVAGAGVGGTNQGALDGKGQGAAAKGKGKGKGKGMELDPWGMPIGMGGMPPPPGATGPPPGTWFRGRVKTEDAEKWADKGFCFLKCKDIHDTYGRDVWCHNDKTTRAGVSLGDMVDFTIIITEDGKPQAKMVVKAEGDGDEPVTNLRVDGLPTSWSDDQFKELCRAHGTVKRCTVWRDTTTRTSKGYGMVEYTSPKGASDAVKALAGTTLEGSDKPLKITANPPSKSGKGKAGKGKDGKGKDGKGKGKDPWGMPDPWDPWSEPAWGAEPPLGWAEPPTPQPVQPQAQPVMQAPQAVQQPVAVQQAAVEQVHAQVPVGVVPGGTFHVIAPSGRQVEVPVPPGVGPGQVICVEVPAPLRGTVVSVAGSPTAPPQPVPQIAMAPGAQWGAPPGAPLNEGPFPGQVKKVDESKSFCFIYCKPTYKMFHRDVFVKLDQLRAIGACKEGTDIEFKIQLSPDGKPNAKEVWLRGVAAPAAAAPAAPAAPAAAAPPLALPEYRLDPADGCAYSIKDFMVAYGGSEQHPPAQWVSAQPVPQDQLDLTTLEPDAKRLRAI